MTGRHLRHLTLVSLVAIWQALMLFVCVPAADAAPPVAQATATCCGAGTHLPAPSDEPTPTNCVHCTNGAGQFVDHAAPAPTALWHAFVERVTAADLDASEARAAPPDGAWHSLGPPAPTLLALRCALVL